MLNSSSQTHKEIEDKILEETRITRSIKGNKEIILKIDISLKGKKSFISTEALLDSGANIIFIDRKWTRDKNIPLTLLQNPIPMFNVDGTKILLETSHIRLILLLAIRVTVRKSQQK